MERTLNAVIRAVSALILLGSVLPALGQGVGDQTPSARTESFTESAETFTETIDVELVNVDVWVTDSHGEPVRGLPASAFTIMHNGAEMRPEYFVELGAEHSPEGARRSEDGAAAASEGEYLVLYVDQLRLENRDITSAMDGLRRLLQDPTLTPEHVLILRQNRGLFIEAHLGSRRADLLAAIDRMATSSVAGLQAGAELEQALDSLRRDWKQSKELAGARGGAISAIPTAPGQASEGARGALGGNFGPDACDLFVQRAVPAVDGWARSQAQRTAISLDFLSRTSTFLAALPGVKTVLYVSGGLETHPGLALTDFVTGLCPGGEALFSLDGLGEEMSSSFFQLTRHMNSNRVTVYPFQAGNLRSGTAGSAAAAGSAGAVDSFRAQGSFEQRQRSEEKGGLGLVAGETGGRLLTREDQLEALAARLASRYSLAYAMPAGRGTEMRVKVDVEAEGVSEVRHRRSFLDKSPDQRLAELVDGALFLGLVDNGLDLRLGAGEITQAGESWRLPLRIQVPVDGLTFDPSGAAPATTLAVRVVARHLETGKLTTIERTFRIKQPEGAVAPGSRAQLPVDLDLGAGPCSIAVGLREEISGAVSVVSTALEVGS